MGEGQENMMVDLYDESRDTFFTVSVDELLQHAALDEADKLRFRTLNQEQTVEENQSTLQAQFRLAQRDRATTCLVSMNGRQGVLGGTPNPAANLDQWIAWADQAPAQRLDQPALLLITSKPGPASQVDYQNMDRKIEQKSFYTGSGWFNMPRLNGQGAMSAEKFMPFIKTVCLNAIGRNGLAVNFNPARLVGLQNVVPPDADRNLIFKKLMMGTPSMVAVGPLNTVIRMGMRPNLHIGRMVLANKKPNNMRFVHVAGHIMAQTVVTRSLATRLMQQVYQNLQPGVPLADDVIKIRELFGISEAAIEACDPRRPPLRASYYGLETSVLAYMAAAMLHPDSDLRERCKAALAKERKFDMDAIADDILTWVKFFLNALPTPNQGAASPMFDAFDQVRVCCVCVCEMDVTHQISLTLISLNPNV